MVFDKIMGFTNSGPVGGKVEESVPPQYPGQTVSHKVTGIEGYAGWLDEGNYVEFDQNKWNAILKEWNKILIATTNIRSILQIPPGR